MVIVTFLLNIAGATMLLLFAVRLVRTGIERRFGASFQRIMSAQRSPARASLVGLTLAIVLQSSAAVALLTSGFAASGALTFGTGLAIVLGGDLGSALIIQVLSFDLDWLVPALLALGGWLFVKTEARHLRQAGRIVMGVALILVSLQFLRAAMDPIRDSAFLPAIAEYLARDYITAFIVGGALAFALHSSVAAILMCVTLVQVGAIPFAAGLSLVLGANLGLRGAWALACVFGANLYLNTHAIAGAGPGQMLINAHIAFNAALLVLALPFCALLRRPLEALFPDAIVPVDAVWPRTQTVLDPANFGTPAQALSSLKRELLHMTELVEAMFHPVIGIYRTGAKDQIRAVQALDAQVNACLTKIRAFVAGLPTDVMTRETGGAARDMLEYAVRLETAGDVVAERLMVLAGNLHRAGGDFSVEGWSELQVIHENILANMKLASNVLISDDLESARLLNMEKTEVKRAERNSRKQHFRRLQSGQPESIASSDVHLETLRALRDFNSNIAAVATPILYANGQLLETRLIQDMPTRGRDD